MNIRVLVWTPSNLEHIARHGVQKEEAEEVAYRYHHIRRLWKGRYAVHGQTYSGRYLIVIVDSQGEGKAYVVTAREMTDVEKKRFRRYL